MRCPGTEGVTWIVNTSYEPAIWNRRGDNQAASGPVMKSVVVAISGIPTTKQIVFLQ
jgi:hypothetical protein